MRILFIAPLPPPITGQALASQIFLNDLEKCNDVNVVNLSRDRKHRRLSFHTLLHIAQSYMRIWREQRKADAIYLTISESRTGNLKDLIIYLICIRKLGNMLIHLHGGAGMSNIMQKRRSILRIINCLFIRRLGGIVVLGQSMIPIYKNTISQDKLHIVPNFAEECLFVRDTEISQKFSSVKPLKVLFLSNFLPGKGYKELFRAYKELTDNERQMVKIDFAGDFPSAGEKESFLSEIHGCNGIQYHGPVSGNAKRNILSQSHVLCLPTYYAYEGQPIAILEAYASGCVVVTTDHSGICDVFVEGINGYKVEKRSASAIACKIRYILKHTNDLHAMALTNWEKARSNYRISMYTSALISIIKMLQKGYNPKRIAKDIAGRK